MDVDVLKKLAEKKQAYIDNTILSAQDEIAVLQSELLNAILTDYITKFETKNGVITNSPYNYKLLAELDLVYEQFIKDYSLPFAKLIGQQLLDLKQYNVDYYTYLTSDPKNIKSIAKSLDFIKERIGFDGKNIIENSYLSKIATTPEVKQQIADYMVNSIANKTPLKDVNKGFKELIKGVDDKSGLLERYHNQYTFDTFNQVDESMNKVMGESLGLKYFLYAGTVMKNTRPFCRKRAGNVYTVEEGKKWNSLDFQGKSEPYNFFIDRGGYNCRHNIVYITKAVYDYLKGQ